MTQPLILEAAMINTNNLQDISNSIKVVTSPLRSYLNNLYDKYQFLNEGAISEYIPELALAKPEWFGISLATTDGQVFEVGDCDKFFTIQSISKVLVYGLALEDHGREYVNSKVSVEPTGEGFNSIVLDEKTNRPYNPMVNAGAIATTDLIKGDESAERLKRLLDMICRYTGRKHDISFPVFLSEKATGNRNRAMAYLMLNFGMVSHRIEETLDLYFQQCAVLFNACDLSMIGATLANGGINPITKERAIDERFVQDLISVMFTCGMYDYSGEWTYRVGIPAKSCVGGGITAVVPGKLGIGTFSPLLDAKGNSVRGIKVCEDLSRDFGLHLFNVVKPKQVLKDWIEGSDSVNSW